MITREGIPLASLSTLRVGGLARYVCEVTSQEEVRSALAFARVQGLPWRVLGGGSNILASDRGFSGVIILMRARGITETRDGEETVLTVEAGESWDGFVRAAAARGLWGIENLAGIPGCVGAAPVQNIGAYGTEVRDTIREVEVLDTQSGEIYSISGTDCGFGYRESRFKTEPGLIILRVSFALREEGSAQAGYADLRQLLENGSDLSTPTLVGDAVRTIRARKFPDLATHGTAGSFFKNPVIGEEVFAALTTMHTALTGYPAEGGIKIPLAFVLDKMLGLRGHRVGNVELFQNQPLVLVAHEAATADEIDAFAKSIEQKVFDATKIRIEREVRSFP